MNAINVVPGSERPGEPQSEVQPRVCKGTRVVPAGRHGIAAAAAAVLLAACGGGGGDNDSFPSEFVQEPVAATTAEGLYYGSSTTGYQIASLVLETGEYYVMYGNGNTVHGVVQGTGASSKGSFTSADGLDFYLVDGSRSAATVSATYTAKQALQGTITEAGRNIAFTASYQNSYDTPAAASAIAGTYAGASASYGGTAAIALTVRANGEFSGTSEGLNGPCGYTGRLVPRSTGKNVFNMLIAFDGANCVLGTSTVTGYAVPITSGGVTTLYAVGLMPDRGNGFIALGQK